MRLPQAIRGLFRSEDESANPLERTAATGAAAMEGVSAPARAPTGRRATRSDKARLRRFEGRLRNLIQASSPSEPLVAGRLQIIALSRVKERLGEDWERLATKVHRLTRQILDRRLADEDVYVQIADRYIILFARLSSVEATFKAQAIVREITVLLIGELPEVDEAPVQITVHEIDPARMSARPTLKALVASLDAAAARGSDAIDGSGSGRPDVTGGGPAQFDYLPIWSRRGKAIVGYACARRQGSSAEGEDPYDRDCLALRAVLASLPEMERYGYAALVVAPIRWDTLVQLQRRQTYLDLCRHMPRRLKRQLGFSISEVPAGAWGDLIHDHLFPLKPFARFFFVCAPPEPGQIRNLADIGVDALAFDAMPAGTFDEAQRQRIETFARDASRHKLATCALGVSERRAALALLAAGVDFLGGDAVAPKVGTPGAAYRLDLSGQEAV